MPLSKKDSSAGKGKSNRQIWLTRLAYFFIAAALSYSIYYVVYQRFHEQTDDAYVNGNLIYVQAQVAGTVVQIGVEDTQQVKEGQVLVQFDNADAQIALAQAEATLALTVRQTRQAFHNVEQLRAMLAEKHNEIAQRQTELARVQDDLARRQQLAHSPALAKEELAHAKAAVANAKAALNASKAGTKATQRQFEAAYALVDHTTLLTHPNVLQARASFEQAYINAAHTVVRAPIAGFVAKRAIQVGEHIQPGSNLMAIVPLNHVWVDANMKESQLTNIRIGQSVKVNADTYGNRVTYPGKVIGISAGTGSAFALLPAQNASGNWIKVVQRIPIRIMLDAQTLQKYPLRVGMSVNVDIDTHDRNGPVLAALPEPDNTSTTQIYQGQLDAACQAAEAIIHREAGIEGKSK